MKEIIIEGYPDVSDYVELPSIDELLKTPILQKVDLEDAYKYGGEVIRYLIDRIPNLGGYKYQSLQTQIQFLKPGFTTFPLYDGQFNVTDWHLDVDDLYDNQSMVHLLQSECTYNTEFNEVPIVIDGFEGPILDFWKYANTNEAKLGLTPRAMEPNKFVTFGNHLHRGVYSTKEEFRFFFRAMESNRVQPTPWNQALKSRTFVFHNGERFTSVEQIRRGNSITDVKVYK